MEAVIKLDSLKIDAIDYASRGNGILGIRDSGKTYTATYFAEQLFRCEIPFITFDPTGVWKFLRVPGAGAAIPVVVAGGRDGDLPLTPASAPAIVEAAMKGRVSLILDMTSQDLSKADWRRIVLASIAVLMQKNFDHGLRHVFIEEAAEFVPQRPLDGQTFAKVEQLVRVGGNQRLGVTLINQRAEEISKSVLELCDNLFLHRQKGKNSLASLHKWLTIGEVEGAKEIIATLSTLPTGVCYAWLGEEAKAVRCKVPAKASLHPDRRALIGSVTAGETKPRIDVGAFVEKMTGALSKIKDDAAANDPKALQARIRELEKMLKAPAADPKALETARAIAREAGYGDGFREGYELAWKSVTEEMKEPVLRLADYLRKPQPRPPATTKARKDAPIAVRPVPPIAAPKAFNGEGVKSGSPQDRILRAIAWWNAFGIEAPSRAQVAVAAGYAPNTGTFNTYVSRARAEGVIDWDRAGTLRLTEAGKGFAGDVPAPSREELRERVRGILDGPGWKILSALLDHGAMTREAAAQAAGYEPNTGTFNTYISRLKKIELVEFPDRGRLAPAEWLQ